MSNWYKCCCCKFENLKKVCIVATVFFVILTLLVIFSFTSYFEVLQTQSGYGVIALQKHLWNALVPEIEKTYRESREKEKKLNILRQSLFEINDWPEEEISRRRLILFWNIPWNSKLMPLEFDLENLKKTEHGFVINSEMCGSCFFVFDHQFFTVSDAVIFHGAQINTEPIPPEQLRKPEQVYVWWNQESLAVYTKINKHHLKFFNYTMTVRRSSDIYAPYANFAGVLKLLWGKERGQDALKDYSQLSNLIKPDAKMLSKKLLDGATSKATPINISSLPETHSKLTDLLKRKTNLVAWIVSNCAMLQGSRLRMQFFKTLTKVGLQVDQYGKCGGTPFTLSRWEPEFFNFLSRYKFYLAMENSIHCYDYMTEKLWLNSLYSGAVPVIFGPHRDDIAAVLPPKSYIHVEDFSNVYKLVEYLHYLDENATAYSEYLEWRTWVDYLDENGNFQTPKLLKQTAKTKIMTSFLTNSVGVPSKISFCQLCHMLDKEKTKNKVIDDVARWSGDERPECLDVSLAKLDHLLQP